MSLAKDGYISAKRGTTKVDVPIDANGNIVTTQSSSTSVGMKRLSITAANADNGLISNTALFEVFLGFAGGSHDSLSNKMTVTWEAE